MPDIRMPDGTVIRNVPEGTTQSQLLATLRNNGYDTQRLMGGPQQPTPQAAPAAPPAQPAPEERGVLGDLGRAIVRGTGALVGGVARPLEELPAIVDYMTPAGIAKRLLTPEAAEKAEQEAWKGFVSPAAETIREAGAGISGTVAPRATGSMQEEYAKRGLTGAAASIAETVAESIPVTGGAILTGLLTRNPTAAMSVMGLAAPQTYTGIRERQDVEGIDNIGLAVAGTAASTALDMVSGVGGAASRIGREALKDAFQTGIVNAAKQVLRTGREEAFTESLQNVIEQTAGGTDPTTKAALLETLEAGLAGVLGGVAFGGSIEGVNAGLAARQRAKVADIPALETVEIFAPGTGAPTPVDILSAIGEDGAVVARTPDGNPFRITVEELEKVRTPAAEGETRAPLSETIASAAQERTAVEDEGALKREFLQLFREQMQEEMTAQPGLTRDDAYEIVLERAEDIRDAAQASLAAKREGEAGAVPPTDTGVDVVGGVEPSVGTVAEPGRAAPVAGEPAAVDLGGLERPVPSTPAADVGTAAGEPALAPITGAQVEATVPTIEKAFEDNAIDFEDAYGVTKLNAEQKKQAARIILQSPEVDPYDAIGSVLDRGVRIRGETPPARPAPRAAAPADLNAQIDEYTAYAERGEFAPQPLVDAIASQYIDAAAAGVGADVVSPERIPAFQQFIKYETATIERVSQERRAAREAPPTVVETATVEPGAQGVTPQQIVDNIQFFARTEAQDRGFDPAMFAEGARDAVRGVEPLEDTLILEAQGQEALDAYKAGLQFGRDRVTDTQAAPEEAAPERVSKDIEEASAANPAANLVEALYAENEPWPYGKDREFVVVHETNEQGEATKFTRVGLRPRGKRMVSLDWISSYPMREGLGGQVLETLKQRASEAGVGITLVPWTNGQVSVPSLVKFYKRHGFTGDKSGMKWMPPEVRSAEDTKSIIGGTEVDIDAFRGRTLDDLLNHIASNIDGNYSAFDARLADRLNSLLFELQTAGFGVTLHVLKKGDKAPISIARGSARGTAAVDLKARTVDIYLRSPELGNSGGTTEIILHEALHGVSLGILTAVKLGRGTPEMVKFRNELNDLRNKVIKHFNRRVDSVGKEGLTEFERSMYMRTTNAFSDIDEFLTWGLTNKLAQDYLRSIEIGPRKSLFDRFIEAFRSLLGIEPNDTSALAHLVDVVSPLFGMTAQEYKATIVEEGGTATAAIEEEPTPGGSVDDVEMAARIAAAAPNLTMTQVKRALTAAGLKRQKLDTYMKRLLRSEQASGVSNDASRITNIARNQKDGIRTLKGAQESLFQSKLLPAVLIGLSTRDITDWVGDRIKAVPRINKIVESMMVYRVGKIRKLADIVEEWTAFNRDFNKGAVALDHVAHIATYYNVDPTKARTATAYMAIDAKLQKLLERNAPQRDITRRKNEIRRVYDGGTAEDFGGQVVYGWNDLSKPEFGNGKGKVIFRKAHLAYQANLSEQYNLLIKRIDDAKMDDKDADRAKSFIEKMMENAREQVIYFPHMRHGTYWLSIGKGANSEFHLFDTATKRNAERIRMQEEAARNGEELEFAQGDDVRKLREGIVRKEATGALKKVFDMLGSENPDTEALRDNIMQMYLNTLPEADMRKHFKRRQFKTGFSLDTLRDFVVAQNAAASQLARLKYANLLQNTVSAGYAEIRGRPNEPFLQKFMDEMDIRARAETQPQEVTMVDKAIAVGNKIAFVWLMTSPKTALIQFTQLPVVGLPVLSAEFGEAATYATATRYMAGIFAGQKMGISKRDANGNIITRFAAPSIQNSKYLRKMAEKDPTRYEALTYGWNYANTRDLFQETLGADLTDRAKVPSTEYGAWAAAKQGKIGSAIKQGTNAAIDLLGSGMHHTERMSREIMYMSSYELAYDKARKGGMPHREAMTKAAEQAVNLTYKAMFDYSTYNKPRLMKFQSTRLASSLMTYVYNMTSYLARNFYNMLPILNKEGKLAASRMFFGTLGMTFMFAGTIGMPLFGFGMAIADIIRRNMGDDDEDEVLRYADENGNPLGKVSTEYWFRAKWIPDTFGPNSDIAAALGLSEENAELLAQAVEKGPVSAITGLNIGSSLSLNSLWFNTDIKSEGETGMFEYLGMLIAGPFGSVAGRFPRAYNLWAEGKGDRAVETLLPGFAVGGAKAFRFAQEGMLTTTGRKEILPQEFFSPWYIVSQTMGFGSTKGAQLQEQNILMKDVEVSVRDRREKLVNRYHDAFDRNVTYGDPSSRKKLNDVWKDVETFNANFPNAMITLETLAEGWARRNEEKLRTYGGATFNPDYPAGQYLMETR